MPVRLRGRRPARLLGAAICAPGLAHAAELPQADPAAVAPVVVTAPAAQFPSDTAPIATRALDAGEIRRTINAVTAEDAVRYLPNILVRRRHIGDTQAPITTRTSGVGASARSLIYADGVLLSALIGNNNSNASPRWGMVAPGEIAQVTVSYGPFRAEYPGNAIGAVVEIETRKPARLEAQAEGAAASQHFAQYGVRGDYATRTGSLGAGDRRGRFWWRADYQRLVSDSQPLSYVTMVRPAQPSAAGAPVIGGFADLNRTGQPIAVAGAGGLEHQTQDLAKLKLGADLSPALQVRYLLGYFGQRDEARAQSFLRDAAGAPVYAGTVNLGGYAYSLPGSAFAGGVYRLDEGHWMQALSLAGAPRTNLSWKAVATAYDYARDAQRSPAALPAGLSGGPGALLDMSGTGWRTLDLSAAWRPRAEDDGGDGANRLRAGLHLDRYQLKSRRYALADWRLGPAGALTQASLGKTETRALWLEDAVRLAPSLDLTVGARLERWRAFGGLNLSASPPLDLAQPARSDSAVSPKAVLAWREGRWRASVSFGQAYRFPTVTELYQTVTDGPDLRAPAPDLRPERARSGELSVERSFGPGRASRARLSLFSEDIKDALIAQSTPLPGGSGRFVSFVQNVDQVRSRGAELVLEARDVWAEGLDITASATYVASRIGRDTALPAAQGKRTPQVPRLRWTAVASYRATPRLTLTAAARYSDRSFAAIDNSDTVSHTWQSFDGYLVADVRAVFRLDRHWSAALGVDNLTDRRYFLFHPFPGRTVIAQLTYALDGAR